MQNSGDIAETILRDREKGASRLEAEYRERLYSVAFQLCHDADESEDLVFRTIERVIVKIETYEERDSFYDWMCVILQYLYRDSHRSKMTRGTMPVGGPAEMEAFTQPLSADAIIEAVDADIVRRALDKIAPRMREVLMLHYFMDMPVKQIARTLMLSPGTVMSRLHYARRALAERLGAKLKKPAVAVAAAALFLMASAATVVGVLAAVGGEESANGAAPSAGVFTDIDKIPALDSQPSDGAEASTASTKQEKTTMSEITIGGLFRMVAKRVSTLAVTFLAANAANAADPYIESDGTAGLNMGYIMKPTSRLEVDFALTDIGDNTKDNRVFGADTVASGMTYSLYRPNTDTYLAFCIGNGTSVSQYWSSVRASVDGRHTAVFDIFHDRIALLTGSVTNWSRATGHSSFPTACKRPLTLFGDTASSSAYASTRTLPARIYGVKIYESDVLVHDYEPCEKDGMRGYKDRVGGGLVTAVNETYYGSLTLGGDYTKYSSPYIETPENNANTYINTGYHAVSNSCVALDCTLISDWAYGGNGNGMVVPFSVMSSANYDSVAGNYSILYAYFRHDNGFVARTLNTSGGWMTVCPVSMLTNGMGGVIGFRRTFGIDTMRYYSNGNGVAYVVTAGVTNNLNAVHPLRLTKPTDNSHALGASYSASSFTSLKIYGCRIAENGAAVRDYVPAEVDGVPGLKDSIGGGFVGAAVGTLTPGGFVPTVTASASRVFPGGNVTFTASAPGAVGYRWFRNGELIPEATGATLVVDWRRGKMTDTYQAASVSACAGESLVSEISDGVKLENVPKGLAIVIY